MKVLLIDDKEEDRKLTQIYLSKSTRIEEKIKIEESTNLTTGLDKIKKSNFDVVLLDLGLPETEGLNTVQKVLEFIKSLNKQLPVIILTGLEDYKIGREAIRLGAKDFLIKGDAKMKEIERALIFATYTNNMPKRKSLFSKKKRG
jgi:DNA-binding NarL/FixJ family response regulator